VEVEVEAALRPLSVDLAAAEVAVLYIMHHFQLYLEQSIRIQLVHLLHQRLKETHLLSAQ
jgi:hypothetical protein